MMLMDPVAPRPGTRHRLPRPLRLAAVSTLLTLTAAGCGEALPEPVPGQSPAAYSGLGVGEDRIEYAIGKVTDIVEEELESSGIPGAAVAVVHGGQVVLAEGFGVRDSRTGADVDERTVFPLASISAPVSATVVAAQSADGEVDWSTRVAEHLPWFELADPRISPLVTVGDLFAHRSGLPAHAGDDLEDLGYDRPAILHGLRHLPLTQFRASYADAPFGLTAGAAAVAAAAGTPWDQLGSESLFEPLGMSDTSFSHDDLLDRGNRAVGHVRATGRATGESDTAGDSTGGWVPADPGRDPDAQSPAGGLSSSVTDMAQWMAMVLRDGTATDGAQVVPAPALREALTPQVVSAPPQSAVDRPGAYGYGFHLSTSSSGRVQWSHSGAFTRGAGTAMLMMPSLDLGIITLTNASPGGVPETINARVADLAQYGDRTLDWGELYGQALGPRLDPVGDLARARQPARPEPSRPLDQLVGFYRTDYFGAIEVRRDAETLSLAMGRGLAPWPLEHWDGDTYAASPESETWTPGSRGSVTFDGDRVTVDLLDGNGLGTFFRVAQPESGEPGEPEPGA